MADHDINGPLAEVTPLPAGEFTIPDTLVKVDPNLDIAETIGFKKEIKASPVFSDDTWNLDGHPGFIELASKENKRLEFAAVPTKWRPLVKRWALFKLNPEIINTYPQLDAPTVRRTLSSKRSGVRPITVEIDVKHLHHALSRLEAAGIYTVQPGQWEQVKAALRVSVDKRFPNVPSTKTLRVWHGRLLRLHKFGEAVGWPSPFGSLPFGGRSRQKVFPSTGSDRDDGRNVVRPSPDVAPYLGAALFVIDNLGENILDMTEWFHDTRHAAGPPTADWYELKDRLRDVILDQAQKHGAYTGYEHAGRMVQFNSAYDFIVGSSRTPATGRSPLPEVVAEVGEELGIDLKPRLDVPLCPVSITELDTLSGGQVPWTESLLWHRYQLKFWVGALVESVAYYLDCALGLHDTFERSTLQVGCIEVEQVWVNGLPVERRWLNGHLVKGRGGAEPFRWPAVDRVVTVVEMMERLQNILEVAPVVVDSRLPDSVALITNEMIPDEPSSDANKPYRVWLRKPEDALKRLRKAAKHLHAKDLIGRDLEGIPAPNNRQTRITAMHGFADRPLGQAVAALMTGWTSQHVQGGYTGDVFETVRFSADAKALAEAQYEATVRHLQFLADNADTVAGNGVAKAEAAINEHPDSFVTADIDGEFVANLKPLTKGEAKKLGSRNRNVAWGPHTVCFHEPATALCGGMGAPDFRLCHPGVCPNSVMTLGHMARLQLIRLIAQDEHPELQFEADQITEDAGEFIDEAEGPDGTLLTDMTKDELIDLIDAETEEYLDILQIRLPSDDQGDPQ